MNKRLIYRHSNCSWHNWLVYKFFDEFFSKNRKYLKGVLVDLGCGDRFYESYFQGQYESYFGVDWKNSIHSFQPDLAADLNMPLPLESESADTVLAISVLEHLSEPSTFVKEGYRILKPGGCFIIQVPFMWGIHEAPYDFQRYTKYGLGKLFDSNLINDYTIQEISGFWSMFVLKLCYQLRRLTKKTIISKVTLDPIVMIFCIIIQVVGKFLDTFWPATSETLGYFILIHKETVDE